jgi:DNA ligase (NAD+)
MDIEGMGYKTIDLLLREKLIEDPADLFLLQPSQLLSFEGWGEVSVGNLMKGIEAARHRPLARLLVALGIRHVGATVARLLARRFRSLERLMDASAEELAGVEGLGQVIGNSVRAWSTDPDNVALVQKLTSAGVDMSDDEEETDAVTDLLSGMTLVVTGTLETMSREQAESEITSRGGKAASSVSKKTVALVTGVSPGQSKVNKATELGVPVIDEKQFLRVLAEGPGALP